MRTIAVALCLSGLLTACQRDGATNEPAPPSAPVSGPEDADMESAPFPELKRATMDGEEFDLSARRGKWVVVNFWATWCAPCLREIVELSALQRDDARVEVVGVAYEEITPDRMRVFLKEHPAAYPIVLIDPTERPGDFPVPRGLPVSYLLAPDGRVARRFLGAVTATQIQDAIGTGQYPALIHHGEDAPRREVIP